MGNSTTFLTLPAHQLLGTQLVYAEKKVDFSLESTAAAGTLDNQPQVTGPPQFRRFA